MDANTKNLTANQRAIILNAIALDTKLNPAVDDFARTSGGLANHGLLGGLPSLLSIVVKVAESVLTQIKKSLGISSPSREAMKLGMFTAQGFQMGLQKVSPEDMARSLVKPIMNQSSTTQQINNFSFANGVTLRDVRGYVDSSVEGIMNTIIGTLGGA